MARTVELAFDGMRLVLCFVAVALVLLPGCESGDDSTSKRGTVPFTENPFAGLSEEGVDQLSREQIERFGALKLPARARGLRTFHSNALDTTMLLSFRIDRAGMEQFVADAGLPGLKTGAMPVAAPEGGQLGWKLERIRSTSGAEDRTKDGVFRKITVSLDDPQQPTVYFLAFTS